MNFFLTIQQTTCLPFVKNIHICFWNKLRFTAKYSIENTHLEKILTNCTMVQPFFAV